MPWVATVTIGLAAALLFGLVARRVGLSPIVGYVVAGVAVGPHTPGFVGDSALAGQIAEVGVILLMFGVGLTFSLKDLLAVRRVALPGALVASSVAIACGTAVGRLAGFEPSAALIFGLCFTSASTVVIVRGMIELDLLSTAAGRIAVGWSVVEDLILVVVIVVLPALAAGGAGEDAGSLALAIAGALGRVAILAFIVFAVGPLVVPRLLALVARAQSRELFTLAILVLAMGTAFLASEGFGASVALGAFLGGMVVGQSDSSHQAAADALPLRDAFAVLFFLAVGMLFDPRFVLQEPLLVVAALGVVLVAKPVAALAVLLWRGYPLRPSLAVAAGLAQVSEFAFVLAGLALATDAMPEMGRDIVLSSVLLSITASPVLFRGVGPIERWLAKRGPIARLVARRTGALSVLPGDEADRLDGHVVLVGHGRVGSVLAGFLRQRGVPFIVIDQDRVCIEQLRASGVDAVFGDASSPVLLDHAGIARAALLLVTTPDPVATRLLIEHAHRVNPKLHVVGRVHDVGMRDLLHRFPRTQGVHGELELAYAMARLLLQRFGVSAIEAEASVIDARRGHGGPGLANTRIVEVHVPAGSKVVGQRLSALGFPRGALVVTIARNGEFVVPNGESTLAAQDSLLVLADQEAARAIERIVGDAADVVGQPAGTA
jgi:CPA2 family monovalent cation:H+ antiporter-2